ncbi:two-component system response regulator YesN [Bacillus sp. 3255]|nr:two-component system response regulator YesN [Bacillus sp. 3255]
MEAKGRILVVDDEMLVRQGIIHLLNWESEGFQIVGEAANGKEALDLVHLHRPHIILTDIVMPVMDGTELAKVVKAMYPDIEIVVLSSFGEFEYVRSTFQSGVADYMLKPKLDADSLLAVLHKTAQRIPELRGMELAGESKHSLDYILDKLISGYSIPYDRQELTSALPYSDFALLIGDAQQLGSATLQRSEEWAEAVIGAGVQQMQSPMTVRLLSHQDGQIRFLLNLDPEAKADAARLVRQLAEAGASSGRSLFFALSRFFTDIEAMHEVYANEIMQIVNHRFFLSNRQYLILDELMEQGESVSFDMEAFNAGLNRQEYPQAFERLRSYVQSMPGRMDMDMFALKSSLGHSLFNIIVSLLHFHYEAASLDESKYEYFRLIHEADHITDVIALVEKFLNEAMECVTGKKAGSPAFQKILQYIDEHLSEPLTLTEVAKLFHFNASYLSNYFAVHNKEGFNEYLNRLRIDKACELLRDNPALSIAEIGSKVGYSDHSYFTKVFRKLKGISPSLYRKNQ